MLPHIESSRLNLPLQGWSRRAQRSLKSVTNIEIEFPRNFWCRMNANMQLRDVSFDPTLIMQAAAHTETCGIHAAVLYNIVSNSHRSCGNSH